MRILLVEDELRLARSYQRHLEDEGHTVEAVADGETALERLLADPFAFDVVIMDVLLPGCSGVEVCGIVRQQGIRVPILLLTALGDTENKVAGLDAGADDYLTKPFPMDELFARLRALARRPHLFEPFYRAKAARTGGVAERGTAWAVPQQGAGLGLAVARWIVQAHGGTISAISEPGQGAMFMATFPLAERQRTSHSASPSVP